MAQIPCSKCKDVVAARMAELSDAELALFAEKRDGDIPSKGKLYFVGYKERLHKLKMEEGVADCGRGRPKKDADSKINVLDWATRRRPGIYAPAKDRQKNVPFLLQSLQGRRCSREKEFLAVGPLASVCAYVVFCEWQRINIQGMKQARGGRWNL